MSPLRESESAIPSARRSFLDVVRVLLLAGAVALGVAAIAYDHVGFMTAVRSIGSIRAVAASLLVCLGLLAMAQGWREAVRSVAGCLERVAAQRIFFVTQLGKYLPGSVWTVVGQVDMARRHGLSRSRMAVAALLFIGYALVTGTVVAASVLPFAVPELVRSYPWTLAFVPVSLAALVPAVLRSIIDVAFRVMRRGTLTTRLSGLDIARAAAWLFAAWAAYGVAAVVLAWPLRLADAGGLSLVLAAAGGFALAHVAGIAIVPLPAGVGAREVVLVLVLAPFIGATGATSVAIVLRVIHTAADLVLAGVARLSVVGQ